MVVAKAKVVRFTLEDELRKKYTDFRRLGRGQFGHVLRAEDQEGRVVAVKRYRKIPDLEDFLGYTEFDPKVFDHPAMVRVLGYSTDGNKPYVITEYVDGICLSNIVRDNRHLLNWKYKAAILIPVLDALDHLGKLGEEGYLHGDVKADNIMAPRPHNILAGGKLIDSDTMRKSPQEGKPIASTLEYLAPEELSLEQRRESDVYHFTAVVYETLFGFTPMYRATQGDCTVGEVAHVHYNELLDVTAPEDATLADREHWNEIFQNGMHKDWRQRWTPGKLKKELTKAILNEYRAGTPIYGGEVSRKTKTRELVAVNQKS
jgi:serine/threonine protein kinase